MSIQEYTKEVVKKELRSMRICDYCGRIALDENKEYTNIIPDGWAEIYVRHGANSLVGTSYYSDMCDLCAEKKGLLNESK